MTQQSHFWVFIQKKWKQDIEDTFTHSYSLQHYKQLPRGGSNANVHQQMNE